MFGIAKYDMTYTILESHGLQFFSLLLDWNMFLTFLSMHNKKIAVVQ